MLEVFTIGGGEYVVNVLNAVAAWTGGGGYPSAMSLAPNSASGKAIAAMM